MEYGPIVPSEIPWEISEAVGEIQTAEYLCPGVYYISSCGGSIPGTEFYLVDADTETISREAKAYGRTLDDVPACLFFPFYPFVKNRTGSKIIDYEIQRYYIRNCPALADGRALRDAAAYGMEDYPEYFGPFPAPYLTPAGRVVRYRILMNGVFWAETDAGKTILAVSYPRWLDVFSQYVLQFAFQSGWEQGQADEESQDFLYFPEEAMPLALFELQQYYRELRNSARIDRPALMNVLYRDFLDYALSFNLIEQSGLNDSAGLLLNAVGVEADLNGSPQNMVRMTQGAGYDYLRF